MKFKVKSVQVKYKASSIERESLNTISKSATPRIKDFIANAKEELLAEFNSHPITQEIDMGPNGENISGTLSGYGCLFSFIGFNSGDNPTDVIRRKIKNIHVRVSQNGSSITYKIVAPTLENIYRDTPLPWATGRSWVRGIEHGLPNVSMYKHGGDVKGSRSGTGILVKEPPEFSKKSRIRRFKNTSYISKMLNDFDDKVEAQIKFILNS